MQYVILYPVGVAEIHEGKPTLEKLQAAVGGYVEVLSLDGATMWLDEEHKLKRPLAPVNDIATKLGWEVGTAPHDYILGNVVLTGGADDDDGEAMTLPEEWVGRLVDMGAKVTLDVKVDP